MVQTPRRFLSAGFLRLYLPGALLIWAGALSIGHYEFGHRLNGLVVTIHAVPADSATRWPVYWKAVSHVAADRLSHLRWRVWTTAVACALVLSLLSAHLTWRLTLAAEANRRAVRAIETGEASLREAQAARESIETRLENSEVFSDRVVETIPQALLVVDAGGRIVRVNSHASALFGYTREEMPGRPVELLLPQRFRAAHEALRRGFMDESAPRMMGMNRDLFALCKDGAELPVEVGLGPMALGGERYVIASLADIRGRKAAERQVQDLSARLEELLGSRTSELHTTEQLLQLRTESLRISEQSFRELAEHIREVFWLVTPDWEQVLYVSPAYEAVWGLSCASLYRNATSWLEALHPDDRDAVTAYMEETRQGDLSEVDFPEYRVVRPDGTERWIKAHGYAVCDEAGRVYRVAGMAEDISTRKAAEERLRRSEELRAEAGRTQEGGGGTPAGEPGAARRDRPDADRPQPQPGDGTAQVRRAGQRPAIGQRHPHHHGPDARRAHHRAPAAAAAVGRPGAGRRPALAPRAGPRDLPADDPFERKPGAPAVAGRGRA